MRLSRAAHDLYGEVERFGVVRGGAGNLQQMTQGLQIFLYDMDFPVPKSKEEVLINYDGFWITLNYLWMFPGSEVEFAGLKVISFALEVNRNTK